MEDDAFSVTNRFSNSCIEGESRFPVRERKGNSLLSEYEISKDDETLSPLSKKPQKREEMKKRNRVTHKVCEFDPSNLMLDNKYNLPMDAAKGFKVGQRVCIKDYWLDSGTFKK